MVKHAKLRFTALLGLAVVAGCKRPETASVPVGFQAGATIGKGPAQMDDASMRARKPVLIYYVNESSYNEYFGRSYYEAFITALRHAKDSTKLSADDKAKLGTVADAFENDRSSFTDAATSEANALVKAICTDKKFNMDLAIFSNVAANDQSNHQMVQAPIGPMWFSCGDDAVTGGEPYYSPDRGLGPTPNTPYMAQLDLPRVGEGGGVSLIDGLSPLAHKDILGTAFKEVKRKFPPATHRYILITKSHGTKSRALDVYLKKELYNDQAARPFTDEEIWQNLLGKAVPATGPAGGAAPAALALADEINLDTSGTLGTIADEVNGLLGASATQVAAVGITKADYLRTLRGAAMYFPLVVMEACESSLTLATDADTQAELANGVDNVGLVYGSVGVLNKRTFDYPSIFASQKTDFQDAFKEALDTVVALSN